MPFERRRAVGRVDAGKVEGYPFGVAELPADGAAFVVPLTWRAGAHGLRVAAGVLPDPLAAVGMREGADDPLFRARHTKIPASCTH